MSADCHSQDKSIDFFNSKDKIHSTELIGHLLTLQRYIFNKSVDPMYLEIFQISTVLMLTRQDNHDNGKMTNLGKITSMPFLATIYPFMLE